MHNGCHGYAVRRGGDCLGHLGDAPLPLLATLRPGAAFNKTLRRRASLRIELATCGGLVLQLPDATAELCHEPPAKAWVTLNCVVERPPREPHHV